jgi:LmbE family N-acetylglucosaminyl deacetylase
MAPPDDEALACSIILQHAVRAAAAIRVIYATDGDDIRGRNACWNGSGV